MANTCSICKRIIHQWDEVNLFKGKIEKSIPSSVKTICPINRLCEKPLFLGTITKKVENIVVTVVSL